MALEIKGISFRNQRGNPFEFPQKPKGNPLEIPLDFQGNAFRNLKVIL